MGEIPTRIGPYRVLGRLGIGGMAETLAALREHDRGVAQRVCIKRILPAYAGDAELIRLFALEARTMASLSHASIVGVVDVGTDEGAPYLALELVDGVDLRALLVTLPSKRLDPDIARYVAYELALALAYAHDPDPPRRELGVVHRDLSPSNVLVARGGEVRLTDFGLAKAIASSPVTQSGAVRGKIPYMAPEHMRGAAIDGRADLFSLGVVLFECLAGTRPFDGSHEVETMTRILAGTQADLAALRPDLDPRLVALVTRLLAPAREDRFADARAVADALEALGPIRSGRRALARLVESRLGGPRTRAHVSPHLYFATPARAPESATDAQASTTANARRRDRPAQTAEDATAHDEALPAMLERTAPGAMPAVIDAPAPGAVVAARAPRARLVVAAVAAVVALGAVTTGLVALGRERAVASPSSRPTRAAVTGPRAVPTATATATYVAPTSAPGASAGAEAMPLPSADEAIARIVVEPWGKVWVDGRALGRAPRVVTLAPGAHRIEAGFDGRTHRRNVTLARGETRVVRIDITPRE